jgi:TNF receptor-associated factor 4
VETHLDTECAASKQTCHFLDAGCNFESGSRAALESHLDASSTSHLELMCAVARRQQCHIERLTSQLERAALTSHDGILTWKIRDFSAKMEEARSSEGGLELVSLPFFTSQCGYKLQASLFVNGNGAGEGTHMSAYIKILPGEYDSILKWPFRHTVSFSLLDQAEDRRRACNVVESFIPDPTWPNFQRPSREPDQLGFGFPKFVPHDLLATREYIGEDAVFIKIRVDPRRNVAV